MPDQGVGVMIVWMLDLLDELDQLRPIQSFRPNQLPTLSGLLLQRNSLFWILFLSKSLAPTIFHPIFHQILRAKKLYPRFFHYFHTKTLPVIEMDMSVFQKFSEAKSFSPFCCYLDSHLTFWLLPRTQGKPDCNPSCPSNHFYEIVGNSTLPLGR